jgi:phosphomevalonate kinase
MISVKYPGKLYLLGEYLVLEPGKSALVMAVDRYLYVDITKGNQYYVKSSHGVLKGEDVFMSDKLPYVVCAINVVREYLGKELKYFNIDIRSELDSESGKKYGFGSSGVVMVGVIDALLKYHDVLLDKLTLFKLVVYAQYQMNEVSSGGDIAASIYGNMIRYTRYELDSVDSDIACVDKEWKSLNIEYVERDFNIAVVWSMNSHKSSNSIDLLYKRRDEDRDTYEALMREAESIVSMDDIEVAMGLYRKWMLRLGQWAHINIETESLSEFLDYCESQGYVSKVSGAGGGDCAIVYNGSDLEFTGMEVLKGVIKNAI